MHKNHGLKSMFWCPLDVHEYLGWSQWVLRPRVEVGCWFSHFALFSSLLGWAAMFHLSRSQIFCIPEASAFRADLVEEHPDEQPPWAPLVIFLPLRSSRLHRLGYLSIAIHHDFHFIALLRSSTVDDIYVVGHAVSDSCLLLSFASLNYLKIFNF